MEHTFSDHPQYPDTNVLNVEKENGTFLLLHTSICYIFYTYNKMSVKAYMIHPKSAWTPTHDTIQSFKEDRNVESLDLPPPTLFLSLTSFFCTFFFFFLPAL
mmetsp:Transcript_13069/g.19099  ORF Transcript_13069/g.19099 Transcript_13069/m.19099 type:complete len:102 (-) Transcript_13069:288-593(-)